MSIFKFGSKVGSPPRRPTVLGSDQIPFCTSPSQLQEVTLDPSLCTSVSFAALRSAEKTSPMRGRSVKEFEELLSQLKKENFNLKLRIYFLEERLGSMSGTDKEQLTREVVELKVELEALRKEKDEKEDLLLQASRLVELTDKQHQEQLDEKDQVIKSLHSRVQQLQAAKDEEDLIQFEDSIVAVAEERRLELEKLEDQVCRLEEQLQKKKASCSKAEQVCREVQQEQCQLQSQWEQRGAQLEERDAQLEMLSRQLEDKDKELRAARDQVDGLQSQVKRGVKSCLSPSKKRHSPEGAEQMISVAGYEETCRKLRKAEENNKKSCIAIQGFMKRIRELSQELEKCRIEGWEKDKRLESLNRQHEAWRQKLADINWQQQQPVCGTEDEKLWEEIENNNQPASQLMNDQVVVRLEMEKQIKILTESLKQKEHQLSEYEARVAAAAGVIKEKDNKILDLQSEITELKDTVSTLLEEKKSFDKQMKEENDNEKLADKELICAQESLKQDLAAKTNEIARLNVELKKKNNNLQELVNKELWSKNREIEKLQHRMNNICENRDAEIMALQQEVTARDFQLKILLDKMADLGVRTSLPSTVTFRDMLGLAADAEGKDVDPSRVREQMKSVLEERVYLCRRVGELEEKLRNTPERDDSHLLSLLRGDLAKAKEDAARAETWRCEAVDACALLTKRLEELARFLNSLLSRGCFLGAIGRKHRQLLKQAVENSMELSRTINMSICGSNMSDSQMNSMSSCLTSLSCTNVSLADMWDEGWLEDAFNDSCSTESPTNASCGICELEAVSDDDRNVQLIARLRSEVETLKQELIQRNMEMTQVEKECVGVEMELEKPSGQKNATGKELECDVSFASMTFYNSNSQCKNDVGSQKDKCVELMKSPRRLSPRCSKKQVDMSQIESCGRLRKSELLSKCNKMRRSSSTSAVSLSRLQQRTEHQDGSVSDSEAWSEPDRKVSLARMGLCDESGKAAAHRSPDNSRDVASSDSSDDTARSREATRSPGRQANRVETELCRLRSRMRGLEQVNDSLRSELNVFCRWATKHAEESRSRTVGKLDKSTSVECATDGSTALQASSQVLEQVCHQREKLESLLLHNDAICHQMEGIMTAMEKCGVWDGTEDAEQVLATVRSPEERLERACSRNQQLEEELQKVRALLASQQERLQEKDNEVLEQQCALLEAQNLGQQACIELEQHILQLETQLGEARLVAELSRQEEELARGRAAELEQRLQQAVRNVEEADRRMDQMERSFAERESAARAEAELKLKEVTQRVDELESATEKQQQEFEKREREVQLSAEKTAQELLKVRGEEWERKFAECTKARQEQERRLAEAGAKLSQAALQQTRADNDKAHLEQAVWRQNAREAELLREKKKLEAELTDLRQQLDTQVSTLARQKSELEQEIQQFEAVNFELQQNLLKLRHDVKPCSSSQSEHNSEHLSGMFLDKASSRSSGLDTGDFSSLECGLPACHVSLPPRLFRQRSEMSDYVSEDQAADEYGAVLTQVCHNKSNVWVAVSSQQHSVSRIVNSSPDLGIESDAGRLSSMDVAQAFHTAGDQHGAVQRDRTKLEQENAELKRRLARTRRTLEETVSQLTAANQRKKQMEKAICKQLTKTHHVLKTTRCHLEAASDDYGQSAQDQK